MQVVGRNCEVCSKGIISAVSAVSCARCRVVFHRCCYGRADCPKCGVPFSVAVQGEEERKADQDLARGKRRLLVCFALLLVPNFLYLFEVLGSRRVSGDQAGSAVLNTGFMTMMCSLVYFGFPWARIFLQVSLCISIIVLTVALFGSPPTSGSKAMAALAATIGMETYVFLLLTFSRRVRWFLESQRKPAA